MVLTLPCPDKAIQFYQKLHDVIKPQEITVAIHDLIHLFAVASTPKSAFNLMFSLIAMRLAKYIGPKPTAYAYGLIDFNTYGDFFNDKSVTSYLIFIINKTFNENNQPFAENDTIAEKFIILVDAAANKSAWEEQGIDLEKFVKGITDETNLPNNLKSIENSVNELLSKNPSIKPKLLPIAIACQHGLYKVAIKLLNIMQFKYDDIASLRRIFIIIKQNTNLQENDFLDALSSKMEKIARDNMPNISYHKTIGVIFMGYAPMKRIVNNSLTLEERVHQNLEKEYKERASEAPQQLQREKNPVKTDNVKESIEKILPSSQSIVSTSIISLPEQKKEAPAPISSRNFQEVYDLIKKSLSIKSLDKKISIFWLQENNYDSFILYGIEANFCFPIKTLIKITTVDLKKLFHLLDKQKMELFIENENVFRIQFILEEHVMTFEELCQKDFDYLTKLLSSIDIARIFSEQTKIPFNQYFSLGIDKFNLLFHKDTQEFRNHLLIELGQYRQNQSSFVDRLETLSFENWERLVQESHYDTFHEIFCAPRVTRYYCTIL